MNRPILLVLELVTVFLICAPNCTAQKSAWETYMAAGHDQWLKGEYGLADKQYSLALKESKKAGREDIDLATTLNSLAATYVLEDKFEDAKPLVDRAIRIFDKELGDDHKDRVEQLKKAVVNLNNLGVLYVNKDKIEAAERIFDETIKLDPKYVLGYTNRGLVRKRLGNVKGADGDYETAERLRVK